MSKCNAYDETCQCSQCEAQTELARIAASGLSTMDRAIFARLKNGYIGAFDGILCAASDNLDYRSMRARLTA